MSYSIALRTYQTNTNAFFGPVEQTVWNFANGGTWSDTDGTKTLTMGGSGTSGGIRFQSPGTNEQFIVYTGVHNYARWCDIVTDPNGSTATTLHPAYYQSGTPQTAARERQSASCSATNSRGRNINVTYNVATGNNLSANIVIG
ncbi:fruit body lectin [Agrocybe pediades]|nr:fruit body lectin [Agrocybe pediades]